MKLTEAIKTVKESNLTISPIEGCRGIVVWRHDNDISDADVYIVKKGDFVKIGTASGFSRLDALRDQAKEESE